MLARDLAALERRASALKTKASALTNAHSRSIWSRCMAVAFPKVVASAVSMALLLANSFFCASSASAADWIELPAAAGQPAMFVSITKAPKAGRVPVALMLHGGEGLTRDFVQALETWGQWLGQQGVASIIIDSFRGRGISGGIIPANQYMPLVRARATDVERTLAWLAATDWADPAHGVVFGQSMGGSVGVTLALERGLKLPQILFYPYCSQRMIGPMPVRAGYPPSLWLIGASDKIAPASLSRQCFDRISAAGNPDAINWVSLTDTPHMFDRRPNGPGYRGSAVETSKKEIEAFLRARKLIR